MVVRTGLTGTRYYVRIPPGDTEPTGLYRFFDEDRIPECFKMGIGWVPNPGLYARIASGELDDNDVISREEAATLIAKWEGSHRSSLDDNRE
jgi:hypothetical protein